jgi:hypothetical protein
VSITCSGGTKISTKGQLRGVRYVRDIHTDNAEIFRKTVADKYTTRINEDPKLLVRNLKWHESVS